MARRVLIAPDKFKGTLSALEAAQAIATGWRQARPEDTLILQPISDGGDGFGVLVADALNGKLTSCEASNAAGQMIIATYWLTPDQTALIESANVIGLAMLKPPERAPLGNDSTGLGQVIQHATTNGAKRLIIGIGGSATNDGGFGMARGLGWEFLDSANNPLPEWPALTQLNSIVQPLNRPLPPITTAVDVQNPLLGPNGCTRIYGPQKGLNESDLPIAEDALKKLARIWKQQTDKEDLIASSLLRLFSASLELRKKDPKNFSLTNSIKFGLLILRFVGVGNLKGKQPLLHFFFDQIEVKLGSNLLLSRSIDIAEEKNGPFFALIAMEEDGKWLSARGRGGGLALWFKNK